MADTVVHESHLGEEPPTVAASLYRPLLSVEVLVACAEPCHISGVGLVACRDCAKPISEAALACPHCGRPADDDAHFSPTVATTFFRSLVDATFRPSHFLVRWRDAPRDYWKPNRILLVNGIIAAVSIAFFFRLVPAGKASHVPKLAQEIIGGAASIVFPWVSVIGYRFAPRLVSAHADWLTATRMAAFACLPGITLAPLVLAIMAITQSSFATLPIGLVSFTFYGMHAHRSFLGVTTARAFATALITYAISMGLWFAFSMALTTVLVLSRRWVPELN